MAMWQHTCGVYVWRLCGDVSWTANLRLHTNAIHTHHTYVALP